MTQFLAVVADLYTPLQVLLLALIAFRYLKQEQQQKLQHGLFLLLVGLASTYGLMLIDLYYSWWPRWGLDYSTHTALAFCLQVLLHLARPSRRLVSWSVYLAYLALMWWLNYHSVMDMLTTMLSVGLLLRLGAICKASTPG
ncbi:MULTISPECIES: hypothetical protein [unclassified Agarivorans]|uniref:hypothetical protein n=1 Tax=unclassified Agarivorans TaxID=2636026 RepID=UPI0026E2FF2A|nr:MULTISPECIES: hypothetical protein [unclassified Agarivorans]MDO6685442.1 hypothetical protein [Agarivorans sp. 3_MG-2023]MDO6715828.1 hypothetical protein [Agarivorans sp. 2_MG-2023]